MKHTAQSLGKYIGQRVKVSEPGEPEEIGELDVVYKTSYVAHSVKVICQNLNHPLVAEARFCVSILKTYDKIIDPTMFDGKEIVPIEYIYGKKRILEEIAPDFYPRGFGDFMTFESSNRLLQLGFGAIKNDKSSTGYVSVFDGLECEVEK